ncbi:hypothetical protein [Candidatus Clostridium stratigraminis]|uniref:Uncharacterized protein n=1 Tax=Candidatus Clostridium stratigraminis TaxID=3381661 RepID=A0ABW8T2W1_9CLOT
MNFKGSVAWLWQKKPPQITLQISDKISKKDNVLDSEATAKHW